MATMKAASKKKLFNGLMVGGIIIIFAAVLLGVASVQGWFGFGKYAQAKYADAPVVVQNKVGYVNVERSGVAYSIKDGDVLTDGDIVLTGSSSSVELAYGDGQVEKIGENSEVKISINADTHRVSFQYVNGSSGSSLSAEQTSSTTEDKSGSEESSSTNAQASEQEASGSGDSNGSDSGSSASNGGSSPSGNTCTITISCSDILNNMKNLAAGKERYVPSNGIILATSTVSFTRGETVFDVLHRACKAAGIPIEFSWTPMYNSFYVEGINNLYEFDCGQQSGWVFQVNGASANQGSSSYEVQNGDHIEWSYTCNGVG